jgi:hypothetical protein
MKTFIKLFLVAVVVGAYAIAFHYGHRVAVLEARVAQLELAEHLRNAPLDTLRYNRNLPDTISGYLRDTSAIWEAEIYH